MTVVQAPPSARAVFSTVPAGTATVRVWRQAGGVSATVRGAYSLFAVGGASADDGEIPVGVPVSYWGEFYNTSGTLLATSGQVVTSVPSETGFGWVSDPTNPGGVVRVELRRDFATELPRERSGQSYQVGGKTVALLAPAALLAGVNLHMNTRTLADADKLGAVLKSSLVLFRTGPESRLPALFYALVVKYTEIDQDVQYGGAWVEWQASGDEVDLSNVETVVARASWQTFMDAYPSWDALMAAYPSWLAMQASPPGGA